MKRTTDDLDSTGIKNEPGFGEPPVKLQCTQSSSASIGHAHVQQQQSNNSAPSGNNGGGAAPGGQPPPSHNAQGILFIYISQYYQQWRLKLNINIISLLISNITVLFKC